MLLIRVNLAGWLLLLFACVSPSAPALADDQAIFVAPRDTPGKIELHLFIPYEADRPALAHYTEHLVWQSAVGDRAKLMGMHTNASTFADSIIYHESGATSELIPKLATLARVFQPIEVSEEFAAAEIDVVLREYDFRVASNPKEKAFIDIDKFVYAGNGIAHSVFGTPEDIRRQTFDDAKKFHASTHQPQRAFLLATGDISGDELRNALAETRFPQLASRAALQPVPLKLAPPDEQVLTLPSSGAAPRMMWNKVVRLAEPVPFEELELQCHVLKTVFESTRLGGLAGPLQYDAFIARKIEVEFIVHDETHVEFYFTVEPDSGVSFADLRAAVEKALAESGKGIPEATFSRALERYRKTLPDSSDRRASLDWMSEYAFSRLRDQRPFLPEDQLRALVPGIQHSAIDALAAALASPGRLSVAFIGKDNAQ